MSQGSTRELEVVLVSSCSRQELAAWLGQWGGDTSEAPVAELARRVRLAGDAQLGRGGLIEHLNRAKPWVDWQVFREDDSLWQGPSRAGDSSDSLADPSEGRGSQDASSLASAEPSPPRSSGADGALVPGPSRPPPASARSSPLTPRIGLAVGVGLLALFGLVALGAAFRARFAVSQRAASGPALARTADAAIGRALERLAETCYVATRELGRSEVIAFSLDACGRDELDRLLRAPTEREPGRRGRPSIPSASASAASAPSASSTSAGATRPSRTGSEDRSCPKGCQAGRAQCSTGCGKEPKDASLYAEFQACIGRCVSVESRCRMSCP